MWINSSGRDINRQTIYIDNEDISLLSSTIISESTVEERTKTNLSENSLTRKKIISNHDSGDNSTDNEQIEQTTYKNPEENANPIINMKWLYLMVNKYPYATH